MSEKIYDYGEKISLWGELYDYESCLFKHFLLNFFPSDGSIEIFDRDLRKPFLKRTRVPGVALEGVFIGKHIRIYGREIKITGYADCHTKKFIGKSKDRTLAIVKYSVFDKLGEIITHIGKRGLRITKLRMCQLNRKEALELYAHRKGDATLPLTLEQTVAGPVVAMELVGDNALVTWKDVVGHGDPKEVHETAPNSLRALYGKGGHITSEFHGSDSYEAAVKETSFFFPPPDKNRLNATIKLENTTCCVIKPRAILDGQLGSIISSIQKSADFNITAAQMFHLSYANADEFLEVYKGVVDNYYALLMSLLDGPCVALEIAGKSKDVNVQQEFRVFAGPPDPDIARQIRPNTLRAIYGYDKYQNAIHCTDLPEDTTLELEYLFKLCTDY